MLKKAETWLRKSLDYQFNDVGLFEQSLTHRSASGADNERLEFLGDAILDFVVAENVFRMHPLAPEGDLSRLRASLVKDATLAEIAVELGLGEFLILGSGERKTGGHRRESILADAIEAIFGAVYLDAGFDEARRVIERALSGRLQNLPDADDLRDPKTQLQEWLQARQKSLPEYVLVQVSGKAHAQVFEVSCRIDGVEETTRGRGTSLRNAEQEAATTMLARLLASKER